MNCGFCPRFVDMTKTRKVIAKQKFPGTLFTNTETGEAVDGTVVQMLPTDQFTIQYEKFTISNDKAFEVIQQVLGIAYRGHVHQLASTVQGEYNICMDPMKNPHTIESLQKFMQQHRSRFYMIIGKLIDANILSYAVTNKTGIKGKRQKVYMINPYVVRKSPVINEYLKTLFIDISEGLPSIELPVNKAKLLDQED